MNEWLRYATNDDTTMVAIASGGYGGKPSPYVVNIHYVLGYILKTLYTVMPAVNWVTVLYLLMYAMAFSFIVYIVIKTHREKPAEIFTGLAVAVLSFYLLINFFSFTVAAYALLTAGLVGMIYAMGMMPAVKGNVSAFTECSVIVGLSTVLIVLAAMMRTDVINTAILMTVIYAVIAAVFRTFRGYKEGIPIASFAGLLILLAAAEAASFASNAWFLDRDSREAAFYEWGEIRSRALDCAQVPYEEQLFSRHDFSKASYDACYGAFYYVRNAVSEEQLRMLTEWNDHRFNPHVLGFIKAHFMAYGMPGFRRIWQGLFLFVIMAGVILGDKSGRRRAAALYVAVIVTDYAYHFIQRPMLHVMMPTYVMGSIIGVLLLIYDSKMQTHEDGHIKHKPEIAALLAVILATGAIMSLHRYPMRYSMTLTAEQAEILHEGREYMRRHPDKLFFALDPAVFSVSTDEDMWHNRYAKEPYNLAGNWEIYSLPSDAMFDSYSIDCNDPGMNLVNNDTAVFLQSDNDDTDPNKGYFIDLYDEYYGMSVRFEKSEELTNGWKAYRLVRVE